ncbi:hypothetical protein [uncultured Duncaniella sp.]|uniref:hypothetical protein n=1 Tax=uncultured Duncaniella sp. TaxID=2768039 RepID=UPI002675077F|nr:hypothetical protein [uncultured Duncaniella sp.]MCI9172237.1 hypothetical protein [Muribaculaceae bacterium]
MISSLRKITYLAVLTGALAAPAAPAQARTDGDEVERAVSAAKDAPRNQGLNRAAGDALKGAGRYAESIPFYMKAGNQGNLGAAEASYYMYDFESAREYLDKYLEKRTKAEAEKDVNYSYGLNSGPVDWTEYLSSRISLGESMLDRVEKIQIIDSINVPAEEFFDFVKLARSAGSLQGTPVVERVVTSQALDSLGLDDIVSPAYLTETGDDMIWVGADPTGGSVMYESFRLSDNTWDSPRKLFDYASVFGADTGTSVAYPFLMADGVTLYFAADGEESLGGLDIFISRRDEDGFLQPSNVGMPYNSPFNDYLYAVDEINGVGWWATDRNLIEDSVTIYTFIPQELRINYEVGTPRLADYAKVNSIADTWVDGVDYETLRNWIDKSSDARRTVASSDFDFALPDGRVVHRLSDFSSAMARTAMQNYLKEQKAIAEMQESLSQLRDRYAHGEKSVAREILRMEHDLEARKADLKHLSNQVVNSEI